MCHSAGEEAETKTLHELELLYEDVPDLMSYTEQAKKRYHCSRLTW